MAQQKNAGDQSALGDTVNVHLTDADISSLQRDLIQFSTGLTTRADEQEMQKYVREHRVEVTNITVQSIFSSVLQRDFVEHVLKNLPDKLSTRDYTKDNSLVNSIVKDFVGKIKFLELTQEEIASARKLATSCIATLYFGVRSHEPTPVIKWIEPGSSVDEITMDATWKDKDAPDLEVRYCYFPLIHTENPRKIYARAKVQTRPRTNIGSAASATEIPLLSGNP